MNTSILAIYPTHMATEAAIAELKQSGFDMKRLSVIGRDYNADEHVVGYYSASRRMKAWGKTGAFWGGLFGLLLVSGFFWFPGLGPMFAAGPFINRIIVVLESAIVAGGLSVIGAALFIIGIPHNSILQYETAVKTSKFILIAHGSTDETTFAREVLNRTKPEKLEHHQ